MLVPGRVGLVITGFVLRQSMQVVRGRHGAEKSDGRDGRVVHKSLFRQTDP